MVSKVLNKYEIYRKKAGKDNPEYGLCKTMVEDHYNVFSLNELEWKINDDELDIQLIYDPDGIPLIVTKED